MCVPAPAAKDALAEATRRWPNRLKASDGICPSAAHSLTNPTSDHERGMAFDLTHDPANGVDAHALVQKLKDRNDPRVKYIISNRRIWNPTISPEWRSYYGSNPHEKHAHVSLRDNAREAQGLWWEPDPPPVVDRPEEKDTLLMSVALNDHDAYDAFVRTECERYWGRPPSGEDLAILIYVLATQGAASLIAAVEAHPRTRELRARRGW